jgi:transposase
VAWRLASAVAYAGIASGCLELISKIIVRNSVLCLDFSVLSARRMPGEESDEPSRRAFGRTVEVDRAAIAADQARGWSWLTAYRGSSGIERYLLDSAHRRRVGRFTQALSLIPDLPPAFPRVGGCRDAKSGAGGVGRGSAKSRRAGSVGVLHRRHLRGGEKGGFAVGKTKRGKGTKLMAVADRHGLPVAVYIASASPHEVTLVADTVESRFVADCPRRLIGDKAYDSDRLDVELQQQGIELIAPHRANRCKPVTQDGRSLRRYKWRWKVERLFAWLQQFRRILSRHEYHAANFLGFVHLGCLVILMRQYF